MGLFRNVTVFEELDDSAGPNFTDLEFAASAKPARTPEPSEGYTIGFAPALYGQALEMVHVADNGRYAMARVRIEEKRVPPALHRAEPTKDQRDALQIAAYGELMARAFPRAREVRVLFLRDRRLMVVGTASKADVDEVSGLIRASMPGYKTRLLRSPEYTESMLTYWLRSDAPHSDENMLGFHLGYACTLKSKPAKGEGPAEVVSIRNADLRKSAKLAQHLQAGKRAQRLALSWWHTEDVGARFSVDREFFIRGINIQDGTEKDSASTLADAAAIYAAEFYAEAATVEALVLALRTALVDRPQAEGQPA